MNPFGHEQDEPLLVDLSAAAPLDNVTVRAWAATQTVFVSSVIVGMEAERAATGEAAERLGAVAQLFERFGGRDDDPEDAYLGAVAASDIYIGLLGARYGKPLKTGYSATHTEYDEAVRRGLRISVWSAECDLDGRQRDFLDAVRVFQTTGSYSTPEDLGAKVERRLREISAEALSPWVKVGNAVFRANKVTDDGASVVITAQIRDNAVAASLEARRPSQSFGRNTDTRMTWPGGTSPVRITGVHVEVGAGRARTVTVTGERTGDNRSNGLDMSIEGRSADELNELAMRVALFGEPNPLGTMAFMLKADRPLPSLAGLGLTEDAVAQVAELLVTELLVGERGVDHLTTFRLGPAHFGKRRLLVGWMPRRRAVNVQPVERRIEGPTAAFG